MPEQKHELTDERFRNISGMCVDMAKMYSDLHPDASSSDIVDVAENALRRMCEMFAVAPGGLFQPEPPTCCPSTSGDGDPRPSCPHCGGFLVESGGHLVCERFLRNMVDNGQ